MNYYFNTKRQPEKDGGNYEIHKTDCSWCDFSHPWFKKLPDGILSSTKAKEYVLSHLILYVDYETKRLIPRFLVDGCEKCCPEINSDLQFKKFF